MGTFNKIFFGILLGFLFPIALSLTGLISWLYIFKNHNVLFFIFFGLIAGIIIDMLFLKKAINRALDLPLWIISGIYIFYNIIIYSMFMGFPVFNLAMGVIAGYYSGIKIKYQNIPMIQNEKLIKKIALFTA